jgi:hypothetical protein
MPNITAVTDLQGKTEGTATITTESNIVAVTNANHTYKVNAILLANDSTSAAAEVDVQFHDGTTGFTFVNNVSIPAKASLDVLSSPMYVNNNETIKVTATSAVTAVVSYELIDVT